MIALRTAADCQYCPYSLICLGEAWTPSMRREARLRQCMSCHAMFFNVGHRTYICGVFRQRNTEVQHVYITTQRCHGRRSDGRIYAENCFELYQNHLEKPHS